MSTEVVLKPGWFLRDVQRAAERLTEWTSPRIPQQEAPSDPVDNSKVAVNFLETTVAGMVDKIRPFEDL